MFNIATFEHAIHQSNFPQIVVNHFPNSDGWKSLLQSPTTQNESLSFLAARTKEPATKKALKSLVWDSLNDAPWREQLLGLLVNHLNKDDLWDGVVSPLLERHWNQFSHQQAKTSLLIQHVVPQTLPQWTSQNIHIGFFRYMEPLVQHPKRKNVFETSTLPDKVLTEWTTLAIERGHWNIAQHLISMMTPKASWANACERVVMRNQVVETLVRPKDVDDLLHSKNARILGEIYTSLYERTTKADLDQLQDVVARLPQTAEYANAVLDVIDYWDTKNMLYMDRSDAELPSWKTFVQQLHARVDHAEIMAHVNDSGQSQNKMRKM